MRCPIETQPNPELLLAYGSRNLDAAQMALLEEHMKTCAACREFASGQRKVWEALDVFEAAPVSPDFDRRLYQRIEQEVSWWDLLMRPFRPLLVRQGLPIAATAVVVITAVGLIDRPAATPPTPGPESAQVEVVAPDQAEHAVQDMEMMREFNSLMRADSADSKL